LPPYHRNFGKRLVKTPKLYFVDTGLACWLLGLRAAEMLPLHPMRGALFENWVITEHLKQRCNQGQPADLYFWRDNNGVEADLLYETPSGRIQTIEIKSGQTPTSDYIRAGQKSARFATEEVEVPRLIYGGDTSFQRSGVDVVSWRTLGTPAAFGQSID
jgi:predicted AAA+ superfamily ATPase